MLKKNSIIIAGLFFVVACQGVDNKDMNGDGNPDIFINTNEAIKVGNPNGGQPGAEVEVVTEGLSKTAISAYFESNPNAKSSILMEGAAEEDPETLIAVQFEAKTNTVTIASIDGSLYETEVVEISDDGNSFSTLPDAKISVSAATDSSSSQYPVSISINGSQGFSVINTSMDYLNEFAKVDTVSLCYDPQSDMKSVNDRYFVASFVRVYNDARYKVENTRYYDQCVQEGKFLVENSCDRKTGHLKQMIVECNCVDGKCVDRASVMDISPVEYVHTSLSSEVKTSELEIKISDRRVMQLLLQPIDTEDKRNLSSIPLNTDCESREYSPK